MSKKVHKVVGKKAPAALRLRVAEHIESLGHHRVDEYLGWCRGHGFEPSTDKGWAQIATEARAHAQDLERRRLRERVSRDPRRLIELVFSGELRADDARASEWHAVVERLQAPSGSDAGRHSLKQLLQKVAEEADFLGESATFGDHAYPYVDGLIALHKRRSQWIRPLEDWRPASHNRGKQFSSLARHLLARYPVPVFMDAAWLRNDADADRFRDWFVLIGSGESARHGRAPIAVTKRMAHAFLQAPAHYSIEAALRWGQVHALGGDARLTEALVATQLGRTFEHDDFWVTVIRFFVANPLLDRCHVGPIVDYLQHQRFEARVVFVAPGVRERQQPPQPNLSMHGRTADALLRQVERWHADLGRGRGAGRMEWETSGIAGFELETGTRGRKSGKVWRIRELLTAAELTAEGRAMRHCVASYAGSCASGRCSIWAMEVESHDGLEKRQTIEVNRQRVIVQCRGRFNALPTPQDIEVLRRWATAERLMISGHVD